MRRIGLVFALIFGFATSCIASDEYLKFYPASLVEGVDYLAPSSISGSYLKLNQTVPQTVSGGAPIFADNIAIGDNTSGSFGITFDEDTANATFKYNGDEFQITDSLEFMGSEVLRWRDAGDTTTYAYIHSTVAVGGGTTLSNVNVPFNLKYGAVGADVQMSMDTNGNIIFNYDANDCDFTINKNTAGQAYIYNAGTDTHTYSGIIDAGSATSLEVPNAASLTLDAAGEVGVNSTHKGFAWYDGTEEVFSPSIHMLQGNIGTGDYDRDPDVWIIDLDADTFPHGIYITSVSVDCNEADPATELTGDLKYCDAVGAGAFPGGNQTVIVACDTTTGNFINAAVNTAVASGKTLYFLFDADPTSDTTVFHVKIKYNIPES